MYGYSKLCILTCCYCTQLHRYIYIHYTNGVFLGLILYCHVILCYSVLCSLQSKAKNIETSSIYLVSFGWNTQINQLGIIQRRAWMFRTQLFKKKIVHRCVELRVSLKSGFLPILQRKIRNFLSGFVST